MNSSKYSNRILRKKAELCGAPVECASNEHKKGFTLIELSIVLVIIGLIVGGVLTGQDLIAAAKIRATVTQYESFNTAVNTFNTKYNGVPGDLAASTAEAFGLTYGSGASTRGDGDGLIGSSASGASVEGLLFWSQLYNANMIPNNMSGLATGADVGAPDAVAASMPTLLPLSKTGGSTYWWVGNYTDGFNYYGLSAMSTFTTTTGSTTAAPGLTPIQAFDIDSKIDDGAPNTGIVQAYGDASVTGTASPFTIAAGNGSGKCTTAAGTAGAYGTGGAGTSRTNLCQIRMRFN